MTIMIMENGKVNTGKNQKGMTIENTLTGMTIKETAGMKGMNAGNTAGYW